MPDHESAYARQQRQRWLRPDADRWIRTDVAQFVKPGTDPSKLPGPAQERDRQRARKDARLADALESERALLRELQRELESVKAAIAGRDEACGRGQKYSQSQPRVPAGSGRESGQWTDGRGGGSSGIADPPSQPMGAFDPGDVSAEAGSLGLFDITPRDTAADGVQLAGDGRPIDLLEEEERGGHTISEHVGKSDDYLLNDVREGQRYMQATGAGQALRSGSFTSLEAANKLVNATISANRGQMDQNVTDGSGKQNLDYDEGTPTGKEAYAQTERSQAAIRATYSVRVVIVPDSQSERGYRVLTAFPRNR